MPRDGDDGADAAETLTFSEHLACTHCGLSFDELAPRNFSFNSPYGACERCDGLGTRFEVDPELVVPNDDLASPRARSRRGPGSGATTSTGCSKRSPTSTASRVDTPWKKLRKKAPGTRCCTAPAARQVHVRYRNRYGRQRSYTTAFEGVVPWLERRHTECRERPRARADRGLHARGAVPRVRRRAAAARRRSRSRSAA